MSEVIDGEVVDVRPQPGSGLARITAEGDPEAMLLVLEKKASLAKRHADAMNTLLITLTYPKDWTEQDGKMCLGSAGAERIGRQFPIQYGPPTYKKETFSDANGPGYRYICECMASLGDRTVFAQGVYGTRDKFLGYANKQWRPIEDINENHIRTAAYHICQGNAIKALMGIRNIPAAEFAKIMGGAGNDATQARSIDRGQGTQGGTATDDRKHQDELRSICMYVASAAANVVFDGTEYKVVAMAEGDERTDVERAKDICIAISSFKGDKGIVKGKGAADLKGKWLLSAIGTARKIKAQVDGGADGN